MCGCGRTSAPSPGAKSTGPKWSKKMNGPTIFVGTAGNTRRTVKPPRSRNRGLTSKAFPPKKTVYIRRRGTRIAVESNPFDTAARPMRFSYYDRLSAARKRIYRQSEGIVTLGIPKQLELGRTVRSIEAALAADDRDAVQRACQSLIDELNAGYRVPPVRVRILNRRPSEEDGELHGLYEPAEGRAR